MSNEANVRSGLSVRKVSGSMILLDYQSRPASFNVDVAGTKGPVPGAVRVTTFGTDISFAELDIPGLCRLSNLDATNYYEYGIYEPTTTTFYPLGEVGPGESYVVKFSRNLLEQYAGTGTGTTGPTNTFRLKANGAALDALVETFER